MKILTIIISIITLIHSKAFSQTYFQQKVDYDIQVSLDDSMNKLDGNISIAYQNNSSDTLSIIRLHLWPNAYSNRNTALCRQLVENGSTDLYFSDKDQKGWIDSLNFTTGGIRLQLNPDPMYSDIADLVLHKPLLPGETVVVTSPFTVKIPDSRFSRFGHRKKSFYITQWFPKPAVYDNGGWHAMPYLNQGEFYADFGKFRVEITVPKDYKVAATGRLLTASETDWLNRLAGGENVPNPSSASAKTLVFEQDSIHDFAWFADKNYRVMKRVVELPGSKRKRQVEGWVFHSERGEKYWKKSLDYIEKGLQYFSRAIGEYPFDHFTVADGHLAAGGGMEYPMITLVNSPTSEASLEHVIVHELCHNWFYGILASNERDNAWMDEGLTTFFETRYFEHYYSGDQLKSKSSLGGIGPFGKLLGICDFTPMDDHRLTYKLASQANNDQPIQTPSSDFTSLNYAAVVYSKSTLAFHFLDDYLGGDVFEQGIRNYYAQWKFRHPQPANIKAVFEQVSGKSLGWFFDDLLHSSVSENYKITDLKTQSGSSVITLKSDGNSKVPVKISNHNSGESVWIDGFSGEKQIEIDFALKDSFGLNNDHHWLLKNRYRLFDSSGKIIPRSYDLGLFYKIVNPLHTDYQVMLPVIAWNRYNSWMAGVHFTNMDLIPEKTEFFFTPLFDFKNSQLTGTGEISHHIYPSSELFSGITLSLSGKRFAYDNNRLDSDTLPGSKPVFMYSRIAPLIKFNFRKDHPRSRKQHSVTMRHVMVWQDEIEYTVTPSGYDREFLTTTQNFSELIYEINHPKSIDPWNFNTTVQHGSEHLKISAELNYRLSYKKKNKGLDIRLFAGGFLRNETTARNHNLRMSGWKGRDDYLFDEYYFGRNDSRGLWPNQFLVKDGGFKIATAIGQTRDWLAALNLQADLPLPLPIKCYFDVGTFEGITTIIEGESKVVMFNGGLAVSLIKNTLEVYVPLFYSSDIKRNLEVNNVSFAEQIRFVFNIRNLAPLKLRNDIINNI